MMRPVALTVMIVIMLTIMFLIKNMATLHILGMAQFLSFLFRHNTIRLGLAFHVGNMLLATFQSLILFLRQRATSCPLLNACLLLHFALVDLRRIGLGKCGLGKSRKWQHDAKCSKSLGGLHGFLRLAFCFDAAIKKQKTVKISRPNASLCKRLFPPRINQADR